MSRAMQGHIPGLARIDKKPVPARRTERVMQQQARGILAGLGYHTMETGITRKAVKCECERCGNKFEIVPEGWQGNTPGFPDLVAFRWNDYPSVFIPIELKGSKTTPVRKEQKILTDAGRFPLAYSLAEVVQAVINAELAMDRFRQPDERRETMERFLKENEGHLW